MISSLTLNSTNIKVVYLSDSLIPSKRANSVHVMHMCNAFKELNNKVELFGLKGGSSDIEAIRNWYGVGDFDIKLTSLKIPKLRLWWHARKMLMAIKKNKPDLIFGRSLYGCYLLAKNGYKVCFETHDPVSALNDKQLTIFNKLLESPNLVGVVVISDALKRMLLSQSKLIAADKILVAHDGATIQQFSDQEINSYSWPASDEKRIQLGYVGTISRGRGIELILSLSKRLLHLDFHIIGGRKKELAKVGMNESEEFPNVFFHGFVSPKEASIARRKCDILLAPYQQNVTLRSGKNTAKYMSPLKVFEYMESGKAIVASDLPVLREVLLDGHNCVLCCATDEDHWFEKINDLVSDEVKRLELGSNSKSEIDKKYSWHKRAEHIIEFYKSSQG